MTLSTIQCGFSAGEISPYLYGRVDLNKYRQGAFTMRNFFADYRGGAASRAGVAYVGMCLQRYPVPPRDINFQFSLTQGYALEFGDNTVIRAVTGAADNGDGLIRLAITSTRGLLDSFTMTVSGVGGTTEANGVWPITVIDSTHVDLVGSAFVNAYTSGGTTSTPGGYMRVKTDGAYITEIAKTITGITRANPAVITSVGHGFTPYDWIYITGVVGMTNFNGLTWIVDTVPTANTFTIKDLFGNVVDSSTFNAYVSGGGAARIYTTGSPYNAVDLPYLKFTQSADVMTLACVNQQTLTEYPTYDLKRVGQTNWVFTQPTFTASIDAPTNAVATAHASTTLSTWYSYVVTAVDSQTGEESVASEAASVHNNDIAVNAGSNTITWDAVAGASSYRVYKATPSYSVPVPFGVSYGYIGTSFGGNFVDTNITADFTTVPPRHNDPFARGQIIDVVPTSGGGGYTQSTITYTITTSTGSGFVGTPIVVGGEFVAFLIDNAGRGYQDSDTISFSGGSAQAATGAYGFSSGNPANGETVVLNGTTWTFVTGVSASNQTTIGANLAATLVQFLSDLNAVVIGPIAAANYSITGTTLNITYATTGTAGNAYTIAVGSYGGTISGATLTGGAGSSGGATADLVVGPKTGTYPSVTAYYQQRRVYGATLNNPDTYFFSQPGAFLNMDSSIPTVDDDAIVGSPWAQQVNGIQFFVPMPGGLIILTGNGAWQVNGGNNAALTPADQTATAQAYNGCSEIVPPLTINFDILYVQSKGSIVRDLSYNFFVNIYTGTDMTVLSNHLFNNYSILQWCWAEEPYKLVWAIRNDGTMLSLTYLKEQDVYAWCRHDTNGLFVGVCSVTEPPVNAVYTIVQRYIGGQWYYYAERMNNRLWSNVEDSFCVDAGLSYPMSSPNAMLNAASATGSSNITSTVMIEGGQNYTNPTVRAVDPTRVGAGATFSATVVSGAITAITPITTGQNYAQGTRLEISDATGTGALASAVITDYVAFSASASVFSADNEGDVIRMGGGQATIITYVSGTSVVANITQPITKTIPNDPDMTPEPAIAGTWTISTPVTVVTGLNHLEGKTVSILADGSVVTPQVVVDGSITLQHAASSIVVGLAYVCQLQTPYLDISDSQGTIQNKRKNIYSVGIRLNASRGLAIGTNQPDASAQPNNATVPWSSMVEIKERNAMVNAGNAIPLFTGDHFINVPANWDIRGQIAIQQIYPLPANVTACITYFQIGDSSG